jgi:tetratricopeptide (TPR) repeat protein
MTGTMAKHYFLTGVMLLAISLASGGCSKAAKRDRALARAERDFRAERYDRAEIEYLTAFKFVPMDRTAITKLGEIYFIEGKMPQAHEFLSKAVEFHPDDVDLRAKLAQSDFRLNGVTNARQEALQILAKQPGNTDALVLLADTTTGTNQLKESLQTLKALPAAVKSQAAYHIAQGSLWLRQLNFTNAETEFKTAVALDPKSSLAQMALGNFYVFRNDLKQAEACLKKAADLAPLRSNARILYAEFQSKTGAAQEAKRAVTEITQKAPDYVPAWVFLMRAALAEGRADDCSALIQKILERDLINREALMTRGDLLLTKGDGTNALAAFERVGAIYKPGAEVLYKYALANLINHDSAKAIANLNQAIAAQTNYTDAILLLADINMRKGDAAQAVASLRRLIQRQPGQMQAHLLLANAYLADQDPDSAAAVYGRMEKLFPKEPQVPYLLGTVLAQQNKVADARKSFDKALELSPDYVPAIQSLVRLDLRAKNYSAAMDRVHNLAAKDGGTPAPWLLSAGIHEAKAQDIINELTAKAAASGQPKPSLAEMPAAQIELNLAETNLLKAIELKPDEPGLYFMLSQLYVASGKKQRALDELNSLLAKTNNLAALVEVASIQQVSTNYTAARDAYEKAISLDPTFTLGCAALNNLAYIYSDLLPDLPKARLLAEKARQIRPRDAATADTLGWILYKQGEYPRALSLIEEGAAGITNSAEIQFHLGMAHYAMAEETPARTALERAVRATEKFPGESEATNCLAILSIDPRTAKAADMARLEDRLRQTPGDPIALSRLGGIQERDGALDKALDTYERAFTSNPQSASIMLKLAQMYSSPRFHDLPKAFDLAKKAHNAAPDNNSASALLGRLAFETGDYKWAASLLEESARKLPQDPQVSYDLAWAYYSLGRVADAQSAMQKATAAPFSDDAKRFLTMVAAAKGQTITSSAAAEAATILKADPNYVPALMVSAMDQESRGNYQQAGACYDKALARFPLFAPATRDLAILCFERLGDDTKAYELATKARQTYHGDVAIARTLGLLAYRKQDYQQAVQLLKEAQQKQADDTEVLCCLGLAQYRLGARAESKGTLQRALASKTIQPKMADEARRVLAELK